MYQPTIGLEIHTELKTRTKMFCGCLNDSFSNDARINSNKPRIILKDESYKLMGLLFEVHKKLGSIYKEKNYQDAIEEVLKRENIPYEREKKISLKFENLEISDFFLDFVIDNKIILEVKVKNFIAQDDIRQASRYVKSLNLPLAIVANFKRQKLEYKRVVNPLFGNNLDSFGDDSGKPNVNICPICLGHPGTLPTINKKAVESVLKLGLALGAAIPETSKFDRKNYFYPDLPKGYQISQYDQPLALGGYLILSNPSPMTSNEPQINKSKKFENNSSLLGENSRKVRIRRIHLEEDTGRLLHSSQLPNYSITQLPVSLVDFNRAGVPLMELVTEPDIKSAEEAVAFAKELQLILRYLEISDADMEKGQMRIEVNLSLQGSKYQVSSSKGGLGTKVEIKNLNSFRAVGDAIDYEIKLQAEVLEKGGKISQETRGWDENKKQTVSQRQKEESHDYRYFPEPDLPSLNLTTSQVVNLEKLKLDIPELPAAKRIRFAEEYALAPNQVEILVGDRRLAQYFEESASELNLQPTTYNLQLLFNYLTSDLFGLMNREGIGFNELKITPEHLAHLAAMIEKGELTSRMAKDILRKMFDIGLDPHEIIKEEGLAQVSGEDELKKVVEKIIEENPNAVADYKKGKSNALQFLVGKAMGELKGRGDPEVLITLFKKTLTD